MSWSKKLKTIVSPLNGTKNYKDLLVSLLNFTDTPGLCAINFLKHIITKIGMNHLITPVGLHGVFGESAIIKVKDCFGTELCLKLCVVEAREKTLVYDKNGKVKEYYISKEDRIIMKTRFIEGAYLQRGVEYKLSGSFNDFAVPRHILSCHSPLFTIMEWIHGETLYDYLFEKKKTLSNTEYTKEVIHNFFGILDFIKYIYTFGIIHRDLKGNNIMRAGIRGKSTGKGILYFIDWGQAKIAKMRNLTLPECGFGSNPNASPEIGPLGGYAKANIQSEIYSVGVMLSEMLLGKVASPICSSEDYGDPGYMLKHHLEIEQQLPENFRAVYKIATQFYPQNRFKDMDDFKALLIQSLAQNAVDIVEQLPKSTNTSNSVLISTTNFIDTTLPPSQNDFSSKKTVILPVTMPIECLKNTDRFANIVNPVLNALKNSRKRSK